MKPRAADAPSRKRITVLIVYDILPHYRKDVFREIEGIPGVTIEYVAGTGRRHDPGIEVIPRSGLRTVHLVRNVWVRTVLWQSGLLSTMWRRNPDLVIFLADSKYISTWLGAAFLRVRGKGVLFWTIGWHRPETGIRRLYRLTFYRLANRLLLYGEGGRRLGIAMGFPRSRMTVIYNSSSGASEPDELAQGLTGDFQSKLPSCGQIVATAVIRFNASKRLDMLIEAAAILRTRGVDVSVLLVGQGPEQQALESLGERLGVPLYLPGPAYAAKELSVVYERTTLSVVPSRAGLTVLQSLKFGIPVITHDNPYEQMPESEAIVPGVSGDFYEFGSISSLAECMQFWIQKQTRDAKMTALRCRATVESHWSASSQAAAIAHEMRSVLNSSRRFRRD